MSMVYYTEKSFKYVPFCNISYDSNMMEVPMTMAIKNPKIDTEQYKARFFIQLKKAERTNNLYIHQKPSAFLTFVSSSTS